MFSLSVLFIAMTTAFAGVNAETHTITFDNRCGFGTPTLKQNFVTLSTGAPYTANGAFPAAIAYLDTGSCGGSGEGCTLLETSLINPTSPGAGSSTDVSLIPPHSFSVTTGFSYQNGCDGAGATCASANCPMAFHVTTDYQAQVQCQANNVNLLITFC